MIALTAVRATPVPPIAWVLAGAFTATTLDLAFASAYWALEGVSPVRLMQAIAAYWGLGRDAYAGGVTTAALGVVLFFTRMIVLAAIYQAAGRRYRTLIEHPAACGALFGLAVYLSNQYVVVPLIGSMPSAAASTQADWAWIVSCVLAHMLLIGIPLALFARQGVRTDG